MLDALKKHMPQGTRWTNPEGGMFIWVTFDKDLDTDVLFEKAVANKVAFIPKAL
jgi:2-aminoadipate transaminase